MCSYKQFHPQAHVPQHPGGAFPTLQTAPATHTPEGPQPVKVCYLAGCDTVEVFHFLAIDGHEGPVAIGQIYAVGIHVVDAVNPYTVFLCKFIKGLPKAEQE